MPDLGVFTLAVLSVLATPGPTNALLTTSAALTGIRRSLPLIFGELSGYAISISALLLVSQPLFKAVPGAGLVLRAILVAYLLWLAWRLWQAGAVAPEKQVPVVTVGRVFVTTLLNPKAAIFAFAIFPSFANVQDSFVYAAIFAATTPLVATGWMIFGASIGGLTNRWRTFRLPRVTAVVLIGFAGLVAASALSGPMT